MRWFLLVAFVAISTFDVVDAKWEGFYSRGSLALRLSGETNLKDEVIQA